MKSRKALEQLAEYRADLETAFRAVPGIEKFIGKKILVTGGRGLIGSFLTDLLIYCVVEKGFNCKIYCTGRNRRLLKDRFTQGQAEGILHFLNYELGTAIDKKEFPIEIDYMIHCAGSGSPSDFMVNPAQFVKNTTVGAYDILAYSEYAKAQACLLVSSGEVYGCRKDSQPFFGERDGECVDSLLLRSCYPIAKMSAENIWISYGTMNKMHTVIARVSHTYGPTALPEENRVAGLCLDAALHQDAIRLKSEGNQNRSWCYVADCVSGLLAVLLNGDAGQAYNVAPNDACTIAKMAEIVAGLSGKEVICEVSGQNSTDNFNPMDMAVLSSEKLRGLGWFNRYGLHEGLSRTIDMMRHLEVMSDE